jgi:hypothetical protein
VKYKPEFSGSTRSRDFFATFLIKQKSRKRDVEEKED